jgi:hypothetical protein
MEWAELEARALVRRERASLEEVASALRTEGSMFIDEVDALVSARPSG